MAFERPTLQTIIDRVQGDIKGALGITTILRRSFLAAISRAIAGVSHVLHGHLVFISKQIFPDQAEAEFLDRWGSIYGLERNPATFTTLQIDVVFTAAATVPAGTIWQRTDGAEYETDADITATGAGTVQGNITASVEGEDSNLDNGEVVSLQSPIASVNGDATVSATVTEGEAREEDEAYRQRIVDRIQNPPAGGNANDYKQWVLEVSGTSRAWVFPGYLGEGTVSTSFLELDAGAEVIPGAAKVQEVEDYVNEQKPVTADHDTFAPIDNPIDFTIAIRPNTAAVQAAITEELEDLFSRENQVRGAYKQVGETYDGKISLSKIDEAVSLADGEEDHEIISPASTPQPATNGGILTLGTITFQTLA